MIRDARFSWLLGAILVAGAIAVFSIEGWRDSHPRYQVKLTDRFASLGTVRETTSRLLGIGFERVCFEPLTQEDPRQLFRGDRLFSAFHGWDRTTTDFSYVFFLGSDQSKYAAVAALHIEYADSGSNPQSECWPADRVVFELRSLRSTTVAPPSAYSRRTGHVEAIYLWATVDNT